jgi:glycosyltransferase involved in cell wall biosynthesis
MVNILQNQSICILTTAYPTWKEGKNEVPRGKFVHDMAKSFVKNGCNVFIITNHGIGTKDFEKKDGVNIYRFHYFFPRWEVLTKGDGIPENIKKFKNKLLVPLYFFSFALKAISIIRKNRINIINAHWAIPTGYIALWIKALTRRKLVTTIYGAEIFPIASGKMKVLKPFVKKALNKADLIVGISEATVDSAKELCGRKDIYVIPDGIDIEYYKPGPANTKLLEKYNCKDNEVIFFTGRMVERKGHRYLLEAMRYVKDKLPNTKLILGGKGELFEELKNLRREWKLEEFVEMPGFIPEEEIVPLLQSVDLFVLPSCIDKNGDTEGSATAALEAMACGIPAIISEVGGNIGAIIDGEGAYYCKPADAEDLAKKILYLLENEKLDKERRKKARIFVSNNYSWGIMINKYINLLMTEGYV